MNRAAPAHFDITELPINHRGDFAVRCTTPAAAMVACGSAIAAEFTLRISHQLPPTHRTAQNLEQFAKDVRAATKGRVEVQNHGAAQLTNIAWIVDTNEGIFTSNRTSRSSCRATLPA